MTATRPIEGVRPADKVLQALATLAALIDSTIREVKSLDNEFQTRLTQAVHATEVSLQAQTEEQIALVKQEVQDELNGKFQSQLQSAVEGLKSEFELERQKARENALKAVHDTEVLLKGQAAEHVQHARQEVQQALDAKYQKEIQTAVDALKAEFEIERNRLSKELQQATELASRLQADGSALMAELQQVKSQSAEEAKAAASRHKAALDTLKAEFDLERGRLNKELQQTTELAARLQADGSAAMAEIQRVKSESLSEAKAATAKHQQDLQAAVQTLKAEFEVERGRLSKELQHNVELASKLQSDGSGLMAEIDRVRAESAAQAKAAAAKSQKDLQTATDKLKAEFEIERARLNKELQRNVDLASKLQADGSELMADVQRIRSDSAEQAKTAAAKHHKDLQSSLDALKHEFEIERGRLGKELLQKSEIVAKLEAQAAGLATQMEHVKAASAADMEKAREEAKAVALRYQKDHQSAVDALKAQFDVERVRLNKELSHTVEAASKLEAERSGLIAEVKQTKADSAAEIEKARQEAKAAAASAAKTATAVAKPAPAPATPSPSLQQEIERAEAKLQELLKIIENPATELSTVIRRNVEKSEMEAYLRGIRLVLSSKT
jgi:hypothetical protein